MRKDPSDQSFPAPLSMAVSSSSDTAPPRAATSKKCPATENGTTKVSQTRPAKYVPATMKSTTFATVDRTQYQFQIAAVIGMSTAYQTAPNTMSAAEPANQPSTCGSRSAAWRARRITATADRRINKRATLTPNSSVPKASPPMRLSIKTERTAINVAPAQIISMS